MNEEDLEESLSGYNVQLSQIPQLLPTADSITRLELYDLEKDLKEIISVTEESLLALKKQKLLKLVSNEIESSSSSYTEEQNDTSEKDASDSHKDEANNSKSDDLDFVGTKCRVKYTQEWGTFQYHNAMVLSYDINEDDEDSIQVRVLFLNPTHISMVPCKYFLDGKCNYTENNCRFSHGYQVDVKELQEYIDPDFNGLSEGSKCLAKFDENGIWYKATVSDVHDDQVTVSFDTYKESVKLDFHSILPLVPSSESVSDDNSSDTDSVDVELTDNVSNGQLSYKSVSMSGPLGSWEEHTKGFGSKLMMKMGYIIGKGLGKDGQGRIEPVEIRLLPPGKSLDKIAELREKGLIKDPTKKKKRKSKSGGKEVSEKTGTTTSAFDLINQLTHKNRGGNKTQKSSASDQTVSFGTEEAYKLHKKDISKQKSGDVRQRDKHKGQSNLNLHMFKNSEKITTLKKKLARQKEALTRNPGNSTVSLTIKKNIELTQNELDELLKIDKTLQNQIRMKHQSKKLSVF